MIFTSDHILREAKNDADEQDPNDPGLKNRLANVVDRGGIGVLDGRTNGSEKIQTVTVPAGTWLYNSHVDENREPLSLSFTTLASAYWNSPNTIRAMQLKKPIKLFVINDRPTVETFIEKLKQGDDPDNADRLAVATGVRTNVFKQLWKGYEHSEWRKIVSTALNPGSWVFPKRLAITGNDAQFMIGLQPFLEHEGIHGYIGRVTSSSNNEILPEEVCILSSALINDIGSRGGVPLQTAAQLIAHAGPTAIAWRNIHDRLTHKWPQMAVLVGIVAAYQIRKRHKQREIRDKVRANLAEFRAACGGVEEKDDTLQVVNDDTFRRLVMWASAGVATVTDLFDNDGVLRTRQDTCMRISSREGKHRILKAIGTTSLIFAGLLAATGTPLMGLYSLNSMANRLNPDQQIIDASDMLDGEESLKSLDDANWITTAAMGRIFGESWKIDVPNMEPHQVRSLFINNPGFHPIVTFVRPSGYLRESAEIVQAFFTYGH
jgi:hypothetical protein